jgi:hypothetical protein
MDKQQLLATIVAAEQLLIKLEDDISNRGLFDGYDTVRGKFTSAIFALKNN